MRFRRKATAQPQQDVAPEPDVAGDAETPAPAQDAPVDVRRDGPRDIAETDVTAETEGWVDLTSLLVTGHPGLELRMQVDERSGEVAAVLFVGQDGAVEVRPFAAPRTTSMWEDVRRQIASETSRRGGTATEGPGPFGTELRVLMPVTTEDGRTGQQPSRVLGIDGPRWFLRATLMGRPAVEVEAAEPYLAAVRSLVVVRGNVAMAPGDALPITVPPQARRVSPDPAAQPQPGDG